MRRSHAPSPFSCPGTELDGDTVELRNFIRVIRTRAAFGRADEQDVNATTVGAGPAKSWTSPTRNAVWRGGIRLLLLLLLSVWFSVSGYAAPSKEKLQRDLERDAAEYRKTLPQFYNDGWQRVDAVEVRPGQHLVYTVTLMFSRFDADPRELRHWLLVEGKQALCAQTSVRKLLARGVTVTYQWFSKHGEYLEFLTLTTEECRRL